MENIAILVDVQNVYYTTRDKYRSNFDYNQFWYVATEGRHVVAAHAYAISSQDPKQRQFHHILRGVGFDVKLKPFIQRRDGSAKGDWDVGIALDAIELAENVDTIVLVSGDGDFEILVERIKQRFGKKVEVYGVPGLTAQNLIDSASKFVPIEKDFLL
ncbi:NYN domain-containing protein [Vibrio sp. IB15]|uniref:NYN domain-containing protein n=1 Tax=Vibrio chagasii TaxID=170679 RepID=A0A7V7TH05_9VIBR|nr:MULTISPECIES: NYN domain-containing protein [Vibrio]MDE9381683.1 NYN domain-containing protein [Vibrio alginolyticus]KAB0480563.1 NYN domain-containing protein [Vibrio chagasii]MBJ2145994.1 NYN domain-containing protein [Vibrio sp. IB15]MCG9561201.1 NYN domain-containing protein [Vibrio chagasii]MCG9606080.1 NYN domain-containing protein [Vibrio chagasii]